MASTNDDSRDALHDWRSTATHAWRRTSCGWPNEEQVLCVTLTRDVHGDPLVTVRPERRLKSGPNRGLWGNGRGDIHSRKAFYAFLTALVEAGFRADFLTLDDIETLLLSVIAQRS